MNQRVVRPLFGLEFEMSFTALNERAGRVRPGSVLQQFMSTAGARYAHLPAQESTGIFLGNGGRLYLDCGKPEITTPEVMTPTDACRYTLASEAILLDISREVVASMDRVQQIILTRGNVSYSGSGNAWACHESYGYRHDGDLPAHFIPHAVSRIVFTGAGGFDSRSPGIRFLVSPRVAHLHAAISENTQRNRGIFNTKDEPLSSGEYQRLHVICGESNSSVLAQWLKVATTAVVLAMAEAGMGPGRGLMPREPVEAMRTFARDITLTATVPTRSGSKLSALDIQRRLLEKAKRFQAVGPLAEWLPDCCRLWEQTLDRLQRGPAAVQRSLDWAIKLELFQNYVASRGLTWARLEQWDAVLDRLAMVMVNDVPLPAIVATMSLSERAQRIRQVQREVDPHAELDWDELDLVLKLRQELFEIDTRFGQLDEHGIFNALDARGLLEHQVAGVNNIQQAMTHPPAAGRARLRGQAIQEISKRGSSGACEWSGVWDYADLRMLDLSDPFASEEKWTQLNGDVGRSTRHMRLERTFNQVVSLYDRGDYESAARMLRILTEWMHVLGNDAPLECCRFFAWTQARRGHTDATDWLAQAHQSGPQSVSDICDYLLVYRFLGLRPRREFRTWCDRGFEVLANSENVDCRDQAALRCSHAYDLLCSGRVDAASAAYHDDIPVEWMRAVHRRFFARVRTEHADVLRRQGHFDRAREALDEAQQIQTDGQYAGDIADLTLPQRAKIAVQTAQVPAAWELLEQAYRTQRDSANVVGEVRTLLLMGRVHSRMEPEGLERDLAEIRERVVQVTVARPALSTCSLANSILAQWNQWTAGAMLTGCDDFFWGL